MLCSDFLLPGTARAFRPLLLALPPQPPEVATSESKELSSISSTKSSYFWYFGSKFQKINNFK